VEITQTKQTTKQKTTDCVEQYRYNINVLKGLA